MLRRVPPFSYRDQGRAAVIVDAGIGKGGDRLKAIRIINPFTFYTVYFLTPHPPISSPSPIGSWPGLGLSLAAGPKAETHRVARSANPVVIAGSCMAWHRRLSRRFADPRPTREARLSVDYRRPRDGIGLLCKRSRSWLIDTPAGLEPRMPHYEQPSGTGHASRREPHLGLVSYLFVLLIYLLIFFLSFASTCGGGRGFQVAVEFGAHERRFWGGNLGAHCVGRTAACLLPVRQIHSWVGRQAGKQA